MGKKKMQTHRFPLDLLLTNMNLSGHRIPPPPFTVIAIVNVNVITIIIAVIIIIIIIIMIAS